MASTDILVALDGLEAIKKETLGKPEGLNLPSACQATAFGWAMNHEGNEQRLAGGVANVGRIEPQALFFTKQLDEATPQLVRSALRGVLHKTGELHCYRQVNGTNIRYFTIKMFNVLIASVTPGVEFVEGRIMERVGLRFERFEAETFILDDKGGKSKGGVGEFNFVKYA